MIIKNTKRTKRGFTLTEVLVVVLIIGVISAIAYPVYTKSINKSRAVEAINLLEMVRNKQIANFARRGEYLPNFTGIGQLTGNASAEAKTSGDAILTVNDKYEIAMNSVTNCMTAAYVPAKGKPASFTFSSSYEQSGLGCDGEVCKSFGNIVGDSKSVCNCGDKTCHNQYVQNEKTCVCECHLECEEGGKCFNKNPARTESRPCGYNDSGTQTRHCSASCSSSCDGNWGDCTAPSCNPSTKPATSQPCSGGCGSATRIVTCNNGTWETGGWRVSCTSPTQKKPTIQKCGNNGTQTRSCWATCDGGDCGQWRECEDKECRGPEPVNKQACGKCGTRTRKVTCDRKTGRWFPSPWTGCRGEGVCDPNEEPTYIGASIYKKCDSSCQYTCEKTDGDENSIILNYSTCDYICCRCGDGVRGSSCVDKDGRPYIGGCGKCGVMDWQ